MDETINKETGVGTPGVVEEPTQQPSETQPAPSAVDEASLKAILEPLVQAEVERRTQSIKDKRIAKQESRISSLEDTLAQYKELKAEGMSEKQIVQFMRVNEFLDSQGQEVPPEAPPEEELAAQPLVAVDAILSSALNLAGLKVDDPDVIEIIRRHPKDIAMQIQEVDKLSSSRKQAQQTPASPGASLSTGGGETVEGESLDSITKELNELFGKPATPENRKRISELRIKQRELLPKG